MKTRNVLFWILALLLFAACNEDEVNTETETIPSEKKTIKLVGQVSEQTDVAVKSYVAEAEVIFGFGDFEIRATTDKNGFFEIETEVAKDAQDAVLISQKEGFDQAVLPIDIIEEGTVKVNPVLNASQEGRRDITIKSASQFKRITGRIDHTGAFAIYIDSERFKSFYVFENEDKSGDFEFLVPANDSYVMLPLDYAWCDQMDDLMPFEIEVGDEDIDLGVIDGLEFNTIYRYTVEVEVPDCILYDDATINGHSVISKVEDDKVTFEMESCSPQEHYRIVFYDYVNSRQTKTSVSFDEEGTKTLSGLTCDDIPTEQYCPQDITFQIESVEATGDQFCSNVTTSALPNVAGFQIGFAWDPAVMEIESVNPNGVFGENFRYNLENDEGNFRSLFIDSEFSGISLAEGSSIVEFCWTIHDTNRDGAFIRFFRNFPVELIDGSTLDVLPVCLTDGYIIFE